MIESLLFDYAAPTRGITPSFGENDEVSPPRKTSPGTNFRVWRNNHKKIGITDAALAHHLEILLSIDDAIMELYIYIYKFSRAITQKSNQSFVSFINWILFPPFEQQQERCM